MASQDESPLLIATRPMAAAALCVSAFLAARETFLIATHHSPAIHWVHDFDEILPPWTAIALYLLVYAVLIVYLVQVLREGRGAERLFLALFLCEALLFPLRSIFDAPLATIVLWLQASAAAAMFVAAIKLFIALQRRSRAHTPSALI